MIVPNDIKVTPDSKPVEGYVVDRSQIPSYFSQDNLRQLEMYYLYTHFGLPFEGGWAEQPAVFLDIIAALKVEAQKRGN